MHSICYRYKDDKIIFGRLTRVIRFTSLAGQKIGIIVTRETYSIFNNEKFIIW
jgi:hypothetical protein